MALPRPCGATLANAATLLALAALAGWLLSLQPAPWFDLARSNDRWWLAAGAVLAYAIMAAWFARPRHGSGPPALEAGSSPMLVAYASQTGFAQQVAERTAASLRDAGRPVRLLALDAVDAATLAASRQALIVASTTGEGDPPDHALSFVRDTMAAAPALAPLQYAVLALGDRSYRSYCAFGHQLDAWLRDVGATPLFDLVEVDNGDAGALRHWQHHLAVLAGAPELPDWTPARYAPWRLIAREHLNPGGAGGAVFQLSLQPPADGAVWQAGDIAEVGPRNPPQDVAACLARCGLRGDARVAFQGEDTAWEDALSRAHLGAFADAAGLDAQALAQRLQPLPHREYSIASLPSDGRLQFLLRRMLRPDGTPGLASGWLCDHVRVGAPVDVRLRGNANFRPPDPARPMILVGNGTGIGGLRAHLKARIVSGARRNWLLFGERNRAHDRFFGNELDAWLREGGLSHLDLAFSRDPGGPRYVQDALRAQADRLRAWLDDGAAVYVCGSLEGMAPGVDAVLREVAGSETLDAMAAAGRYRRDVY